MPPHSQRVHRHAQLFRRPRLVDSVKVCRAHLSISLKIKGPQTGKSVYGPKKREKLPGVSGGNLFLLVEHHFYQRNIL
jgi:hypothetical protein